MADEEKQLTLLSQISTTFNTMPQARRMTVAGVAIAALLGFGVIIFGNVFDGEWQTVASGMSPEDSNVVVAALDSKGIEYKLGDGGTVMVRPDDIHDARLELAVSTMPSGRNVGFELFDESELGRSAFSEKVNYHRALEGELERTITHLQPVKRARVHLVLPARTLFEDEEPTPTASVMIALKSGQSLSATQVKAIRHLVAASVERLSPKQVAVIDETGAMLARPDDEELGLDGSFEHQAQFERSMERRIIKLLEPVVGVGAVRAQVSAQLDLSRTIETEEKFDPDSQVARSEREKTDQSDSNSQPAQGAPGAAAALPQNQAGANQLQKTQNSQKSDRVVNYEIDRFTTRREKPAAELTRLSVAVVIDSKKIIDGMTGEITLSDPLPEEMEAYRAIVAKAVGIDATRGDQLEVRHVPFLQPAAFEEPAEEAEELIFGLSPAMIAMIGGGLFFLVFSFVMWRRNKKKKALEEEMQRKREATAEEDYTSIDGLSVGDQVELLREKARHQSEADVRMAASIIRKWVSGTA